MVGLETKKNILKNLLFYGTRQVKKKWQYQGWDGYFVGQKWNTVEITDSFTIAQLGLKEVLLNLSKPSTTT